MTVAGVNRRQLLLAGAAVIAGTRLGAAADGADEGTLLQVEIRDLAFTPETVEARPGDTIEWINADPFDHTATVDGAWDVMIPAGERATHVVTQDDSVSYYCRFHPNMTGQIEVVS